MAMALAGQDKILVVGASKAALVQDTNYMVEKTYHIAPKPKYVPI